MESSIDADVPLDYADITVFPAQNRYEVYARGDGGKVEKLVFGLLDQLLPHLPGVYDLHSKGSDASLKLQVTGLADASWFTKSTLKRFLQIVSSPSFMNSSKIIEDEMSQLEDAIKFHLSIYSQGCKDDFESRGTDSCNSTKILTGDKPDLKSASSDTSKDELLRAMDLRLTALRRELAAGLRKDAGLSFSSKDIMNLIIFCDHFGAAHLKSSLCKLSELSLESGNDDKSSSTCMSIGDDETKVSGDTHIARCKPLEGVVKYGASPAMVAQLERQSSSQSEDSSDSSDENESIAARSRTLTRSAQPRRSASPMRRVQIGRTGSRKAPALTIKSLGHFPGREKPPFSRDTTENSSDEEGSEQIGKKSENNVRRMTVQDAINLFESKQKDQSADADARRRVLSSNLGACANRSVLRRWSAGTAECFIPCQSEVSEDSIQLSCNHVTSQENSNWLLEKNMVVSDYTSGCQNLSETANFDVQLERLEKGTDDPLNLDIDTNATRGQETNEASAASAELSQQKKVEFNQMYTKMKGEPVRNRKPQKSNQNQNVPSGRRGGFYDHYKEKRDEKLQRENARKKVEKDAQFRAMQQTLDERKAQMASKSMKDASKKNPPPKPRKSPRKPSQSANAQHNHSKASVPRNVSSNASAVSATRKSWPSIPLSSVAGSSPSRISPGFSSAVNLPTVRKPWSTSPGIRSRPKVQRSEQQHINLLESQTDTNRNLKVVKKKQQQPLRNNEKTTKRVVAAHVADRSSKVPSKPSLCNKMTKKSSVVPVETKPLRKVSGVAQVIGPLASNKKCSSQLAETSTNSGNIIEARENEVAASASFLIVNQNNKDIVSNDHANDAGETEILLDGTHQSHDESLIVSELAINGDESSMNTAESAANFQCQEELFIPPTIWEEIDERVEHSPHNNDASELTTSVHVAPLGLSSPRIRHSLSQMLQEESSEPDTLEWGNAGNTPAMAYQKDAPKGFKRLLKFARRAKGAQI